MAKTYSNAELTKINEELERLVASTQELLRSREEELSGVVARVRELEAAAAVVAPAPAPDLTLIKEVYKLMWLAYHRALPNCHTKTQFKLFLSNKLRPALGDDWCDRADRKLNVGEPVLD